MVESKLLYQVIRDFTSVNVDMSQKKISAVDMGYILKIWSNVFPKKSKIVFPRYHQLDVVWKLVKHVQDDGSGHNYLIQHSTGSGKSNSIAWTAYHLASLHDKNDNAIFNSIIVVTDRRVLDQ